LKTHLIAITNSKKDSKEAKKKAIKKINQGKNLPVLKKKTKKTFQTSATHNLI
jgi:hypothetical protein